MEIVKNAVRVGNSAGVLLPIGWLGSPVKVILEPLNIEKDVLEILIEEKILKEVIGVYIAGSYARGEQTIESDVDVLVITDKTNKKIKRGKYDIICGSKESVERQLRTNALPVLAMLIEAKTLINEKLRQEGIKIELNYRNLKWHIETTKSAMNVVKADIKLTKELKEEKTSDGIAYSLILRLRTLYIISCIRKGNIWSKKEFLQLIKKISGSTRSYDGYLRAKNEKRGGEGLLIEEAEKLMDYNNKKIREIEKWAKGRKD